MKRLNSTILLAVFVTGIISTTFAAHTPVIWTVNPNGSGYTNFTTIQAALNNPSLQFGDDIMIWPGTYNEGLIIDGKSQLDIYAENPANKPIVNSTIVKNSTMLLIKDLDFTTNYFLQVEGGSTSKNLDITFSGCNIGARATCGIDIHNATGIKFENCTITNFAAWGIKLYGEDLNGTLDIVNCVLTGTLNSNVGPFIYANNLIKAKGKLLTVRVNNCILQTGDKDQGCVAFTVQNPNSLPTTTRDEGIKGYFTDNTFKDIGYGFYCSATLPITMYMTGANNFVNVIKREFTQGDVQWFWSSCPVPSCPTSYKTPNYPSNYPNNCLETAILSSPTGGSYNVVVNGETESNYDFLYIYEMNGTTLLAKLSGIKTNYNPL